MTLAPRVSPAFLVSGLLHLAVLAALLLVRAPAGDPAGEGPPVAVRLVTSGDLAAAESATGTPAEAAAAAPTAPVPAESTVEPTPPSPRPPEPAPTPRPEPVQKSVPKPAAKPVPRPAPAPAKPAPQAASPARTPATAARPAAAAPAKRPPGGLDLDALAGQVARLTGSRPGPAAPAGGGATGPSAAALAGLQDQLQRRWTPNCEVEGGRDVRVRVSFSLSAGGDLAGPVEAGGLERSDNAVVRAAAERAIRAVLQAAPFPALASPAGQRIAVNFNAREACS